MQFRPAVRTQTKPLIGLYGLSGGGKTMSSLLLARGLVGPTGKVGMIDTESGRGQLYSDVIPGGYEIMDLPEPFAPQRYIDAIRAAEAAHCDVLVIDSASHEWEGAGGVRDMAAQSEANSRPGLHNWIKPKQEHNRFVLALLGSTLPVIVCLRAKHKSRQTKDAKGRTQIVKDEVASPIQNEDFVFELTVHAEIRPDHTLRVTKHSHPDLTAVFCDGEMISVETGEHLAAWANGGTEVPPAPAAQVSDSLSDEANAAADQGMETLKSWWSDLSSTDKRRIKPRMHELKTRAGLVEDSEGESEAAPADPGVSEPTTAYSVWGANGEALGSYADADSYMAAIETHIIAASDQRLTHEANAATITAISNTNPKYAKIAIDLNDLYGR